MLLIIGFLFRFDPLPLAILIGLLGWTGICNLARGQTFTAAPRRPHLVTNGGASSVTFLVLQGIGEYDFVPVV